MDPAIPRAANRIQEKPCGKLQKLRTAEGRNLVPEERAGILPPLLRGGIKVEVLDALGIEMDFAMLLARKPFEQFGESACRGGDRQRVKRRRGATQGIRGAYASGCRVASAYCAERAIWGKRNRMPRRSHR